MNQVADTKLTIDGVERIARLVHIAMLASIVMIIAIVEGFLRPSLGQVNRILYMALIGIAIVVLNSIYLLRDKYVVQSQQILCSEPTNQAALQRWSTGYLITFALCESIALYGIVLRVLGGAPIVCFALYCVSLYTLLLNRPKPIAQ
jgi:hypothetical protein